MRTRSAAAPDWAQVDAVLQRVELELYRDNIGGALELLDRGYRATADPRYRRRADEVNGWLRHLATGEDYGAAYEDFYHQRKGGFRLRHLGRRLRILIGRKTRKTVRRMAVDPEFRLLEREVTRYRPMRVLDAGCGEGRVAITLGARHRHVDIVAVDVSRTNIRLARDVNRFRNVSFHLGLIEQFAQQRRPEPFDLVYSFAVLEHVADLDDTLGKIFALLRRGGRFCFVVPMNEFAATGPLPPFSPPDGVLGHVRCFSEAGLRAQFAPYPDFLLAKVPGEWRPERYPPAISPVEFGSFFVGVTKP